MLRRRSVRSLAPALLTLLLLLGACSSGDSPDDATSRSSASPSSSATTAVGDAPTQDPPAIGSDDFADGDPIPAELTCDGDNRSPELHWSGLAAGGSVALVVDDVDAPGGSFIHWTMWDLEAGAAVDNGTVPPAAVQGENDAGGSGWTGPCPPPGDGPHSYVFSLFALTEPLDVGEGASPDEVREALDATEAPEVATLTGTYER